MENRKTMSNKRLRTVVGMLLACTLLLACNIYGIRVDAAEKTYQRCETKTQNGVTFKVEWDDPKLGEAAIFHLSATGGSDSNKYYMAAPFYSNPGSTEREMLVDPTYSAWSKYTGECSTYDLSFTLTASGTYYLRFYVMNMSTPVEIVSMDVTISASDVNYPGVDAIVKSAVAQCNSETTGSDYDRALWLHDWLNNRVEYDKSLAWCSAEGALTRGLGTCDSYQRAYAKLLTAAGIQNERIEDYGDNHTWNAVKLDGTWYQIDCTWDDTSEHWYDFDQRYMYFGLTDELMAIAHPHHAELYTTSGYQTRSTSLANNYLVRNGDAAGWAEAYRTRIQEKLEARETAFTIEADNSAYPPSYSGILNGIIAYAFNQIDWSNGDFDVNLQANGTATQFTFQVTYTEGSAVIPKLASVAYSTHVQSVGWQDVRYNGTMAGTSGMAKRLEAIRIHIQNGSNLGIRYTTHCQTYGWLPWSCNGEMNGTSGESKRLEAIKIQLTGSDAGDYDVYYRVHAQTYGWLGWAKNGEPSGTAGLAKRLEGIQIVVLPAGSAAPSANYAGVNAAGSAYNTRAYINGTSSDNIVIPGYSNQQNVMYKTHVQSFGWQNWILNGDCSGTFGKSKRLEGINIKLSNCNYSGGVEYRTHIQSHGWENGWKRDGVMSGTSGQGKRLEAIQIRLTGEMALHYDIYYRVHAQHFGWLGWAKNGEASGTAGYAYRLEGIQILLVPKGTAGPASNYGGMIQNNPNTFIAR